MRWVILATVLVAGCGSGVGSKAFSPDDTGDTIQWAIAKQREISAAKSSGNEMRQKEATDRLATERDAQKGKRLNWLMPVARITADGKCEISPLDHAITDSGENRTVRLRVSVWKEVGPVILSPADAEAAWLRTLSRGDLVRVTGTIVGVHGSGGWSNQGPSEGYVGGWGVEITDAAVSRP